MVWNIRDLGILLIEGIIFYVRRVLEKCLGNKREELILRFA